MHNTQEYPIIQSREALIDVCKQLSASSWIALDTEFLREKTYYPKFCLLQIANEHIAVCIDPIAIADISPVLDLIYNPNILKVLHAGRQDMEIFFNLTGKLPEPVFDTQIAAPLLGYPDQMGYANLVGEITGAHLSKSHTRTDWSMRPLNEEQLRYALDDVIYLAQIYPVIRERLAQQERLSWLESDFRQLLNPDIYQFSPSEAWLKIRAGLRLKGAQLSILQTLAEWREITARAENQPRNWLLKDEVILSLAQIKPVTMEQMRQVRGIPKPTEKRYAKKICELVAEAKNRTPPEKPESVQRKTPDQETLLALLDVVVRIKAMEHAISPAVLASKKDLEIFTCTPEDSRLTQGWRNHLVGQALVAFMTGEQCLKVEDRQARLVASGD